MSRIIQGSAKIASPVYALVLTSAQPAMQPTLRFATILLMQSLDSEPGNSKHQKREGEIIAIGRVGDVPPGRVATVALANRTELALYNINGEFYAIENFCPHKGAPLADGHLCDHTVECDWHGWRFDLRTGQCLTKGSAVETYEVIIEDGWIKIRGLKISAVVADSFDGAGGEGLFT